MPVMRGNGRQGFAGSPASVCLACRADPQDCCGRIRRERREEMSRYNKDDIIRMAREEDVEFIRLQFTDIFGQLKNVAITSSQLE